MALFRSRHRQSAVNGPWRVDPGRRQANGPRRGERGSRLRRLLGWVLIATALALPLLRADDLPVDALVASWAPPPSVLMALDGQLLHYRDEGPRQDPEPIVLLHGTGDSLHTWDGWVQALHGQRRVLRLDLPGAGLTGPRVVASGQRPYGQAAQAAFVQVWLAQLGVGTHVLVGQGSGAAVAAQLARQAPHQVRRLVLIAPQPPDAGPLEEPLLWRWARMPVLGKASEWFLTRALVRQMLASGMGDPQRLSDSVVERHYQLRLRAGNRAALRAQLRDSAADAAAPAAPQPTPGAAADAAAGLPVHTLLLWGGRDRRAAPTFEARLAAAWPGARRLRWATLGERLHEEDPGSTVAVLLPFLADSALPPAAATRTPAPAQVSAEMPARPADGGHAAVPSPQAR